METSILIIILATMLHQTSGCSCTNDNPPDFCDSDYAIRGTIMDIEGNVTQQEDVTYSVQVEEVYRNTSDGNVISGIINIVSPGHTCGIDLLDNGTTYLMSGVYDESGYSVDICNSVVMMYNGPDDADDLDLPCSASLTTTISYIVFVGTLLHLILR